MDSISIEIRENLNLSDIENGFQFLTNSSSQSIWETRQKCRWKLFKIQNSISTQKMHVTRNSLHKINRATEERFYWLELRLTSFHRANRLNMYHGINQRHSNLN